MEKKTVKRRLSRKSNNVVENEAISPKRNSKTALRFPHMENFHRPVKIHRGEVLQQLIVSTEIIDVAKSHARSPALGPLRLERRRRCGCGCDNVLHNHHQTLGGHLTPLVNDPLKRTDSKTLKKRDTSKTRSSPTSLTKSTSSLNKTSDSSEPNEVKDKTIRDKLKLAEEKLLEEEQKIKLKELKVKKPVIKKKRFFKRTKEMKQETLNDFQPSLISLKRLTRNKKFGVVPANPGDGSDIWDGSELLELERRRIREARLFHWKRRQKYSKKLLNSCRRLRQEHCPKPPDLTKEVRDRLQKDLAVKYNRFVEELFEELWKRDVRPVILPKLGKTDRASHPSVTRVSWIPKEKNALSRAMASFPPTVRSIMAEVLRPLHTYTLVDITAAGAIGVGEGVEMKVLVTSWKGIARKSRQYLRQEWFPQAIDSIRKAAIASGLSTSRRHAVIYAFNNLLASKLQQVLIRSVEGFLSWLGSEEEPWSGPRVKVNLALADGEITLHPDEADVFEAFVLFFEELTDCVQLFRATWNEPLPPTIPKWRLRLAQEKEGGEPDSHKPLRPLQPAREILSITLSEAQWETLKQQAKASLGKAFEKVRHYLEQIGTEFKDVLSGSIKREIEVFKQSGADLQDFAAQVHNYSLHVEQASHIPTSATVSAFRLEYKPLKESLLAMSNNFVSVLREKLIADHRDITYKLRDDFQNMSNRMQESPKTTEELFTLMEAVEEARRITVRLMIDQVANMAERLQIILDVVILTEEDLTITAEVINWPVKIRPIIEKSVESLEDYKQSFEEALTEKTGEVNQTLDRVRELVGELEELGQVEQVNKYLREVRKIEARIEKVEKLVAWVNEEEALFKFPITGFHEMKELKKYLIPYGELFILVMRWRRDEKHWMDGDFTMLDPEFIDLETEELARDLSILQKTFKTKFKQQALEGDPKKARMNLEDPNPNNLPGPLRISALALGQIHNFKEHLPLVSVLCNKGLRNRHWVQLNKIAGFDITPNAGTSLRKVVKMKLDPLLQLFEVISGGASREYNLEQSLETMRSTWKTIKLKFVQHPILNMEVLEGLEELSSVIEDHLIKTHAIKNSPYVKPFSDQVSGWELTLRHARRNVREWLRVQALWIELSPLFAMADLPSQLPKESKAFKEIDDGWRSSMFVLMNTKDILLAASDVDKLSQATEFLKSLELLQQAVYSYLHNKRTVFPRLFFMSNEELTSLVCEKDPGQLGKHLDKSFDGVHKLTLDDDNYVSAIVSAEGEILKILKKLSTKHAQLSIENWLLEFQLHMNQTMKAQIKNGADWWEKNCSGKGFSKQNLEYVINNFPLQVILSIRQAFLTSEIQEAIRGGQDALKQCYKRVQNDITILVKTVRGESCSAKSSSNESSSSQSSVVAVTPRDDNETIQTRLNRTLLKSFISTLILASIHSRDLMQKLIDVKIEDEGSFLWLSQLRLTLTPGPNMEARLLEVSLPWGWEYVGSGGRLVATPLTARAHLALAIAYKSHLGAAHEGPAGTGKTETVKDLARVLAMHCVVFNCSESVDPRGVALLLTGLAAAGSWLCLDEFNKFQVGVLSVAAQQLLTIISARRCRDSTFSLSGMAPLALDPRGLMVVTLNPEYKGRVTIPDNLTLLLRPVAMLAADEQAIVEVSLMAIGFRHAYTLARRATMTLNQCRTRLEPQSHYDFGLRSVRAVLTAAGRLRTALPECSETEIVIRALREVNQPKLVGKDATRFEEILQDFFPQMPPTPRPPKEDLRKSFRLICEQHGVYPTKEFESKTFQLYATLQERTGILLVGDSCSSKSTIIKILSETLKSTQNNHEIFIEKLNPKTISQGLLVGNLDPASRDWTDGLITIALRRSMKEHVWLLLDGPADASWVEQFNTALDDSKRLCLASGETLGIPSTLNIIFEVMDLSQASPAAVSRCGVVYVSEKCISWRVIFYSWKTGHENRFVNEPWWEDHIALVEQLVDWVIPATEQFLKINCKYVLPVRLLSLIRPVFLLTATLVEDIEKTSPVSGKDRARLSGQWTIGAFFYAFVWSVAGALDAPSKEKFSTFFRRLAYGEDKSVTMPDKIEKLGVPYPSEGNIFDAAYDPTQRSLWRPWNDIIKHMVIPDDIRVENIVVPIPESVSLLHNLNAFIKAGIPLLVIGQGGSGKRKAIQHFLSQLSKNSHAFLHLPITPAATVEEVKTRVLKHLVSRSFCDRAKGQRTLLAYADDLHLASADDFEAIPIQEAIREAVQQQKWVGTENTSKISLEKVQWLAGITISPRSSSDSIKGYSLDSRCLSCFLPFVAEQLSEDSTRKILSMTISHFLKKGNFVPDIFSVVNGVVGGMSDVYKYAKEHFTTTMEQPHYNFSITTAFQVLMGIFHVKKESVETKRHFLRLWTHEMFRDFCDRLTKPDEVNNFYAIVMKAITSSTKDKPRTIFDKVCREDGTVDLQCIQKNHWGIINNLEKNSDSRRYEELPEEGKLCEVITNFIKSHNELQKQSRLDIVVFRYVMEHVNRACRVLSRPGGNLLLVGDGGCGRKSLTKLASSICNYRLETPQINAFDDYAAVRKSLKNGMLAASLEEVKTIVIIGDDVLQHPKVLHILHTILSTGFAAGIFTVEDTCNLMERLRLNSDNPGVFEDELWDIHIQRVKDYLHLVITSPLTPTLSRILALYPAISSKTTIDYYQAWPEDAMTKVGEQSVTTLNFRSKLKKQIVKSAIGIHMTASNVSLESTAKEGWCPKVTPASYLHLLQEFLGLYKDRQELINSQKNKYVSGLEKLEFAASQISVMKEMLDSLGPQIEQASNDVSTMMAQIEKESAEVESKKKIVAEEEEVAGVLAAEARILQEECQCELNQALPALHAAEDALNTLKPGDITVVKSMKSPPQVVKMVMSAVCVMLDIKPDKVKSSSGKMAFEFWGPSKRLLGDMTFLQQLRDYDKEGITETLMEKVYREYLDIPEFNPGIVAKASSAAEGLCRWVQAMAEYYEIAKIVAPKRASLEEAEKQVRELMSLLEKKRKQLKILEEKLENLQSRFAVACAEKEKLEAEQKDCSLKLARAEQLIRGLGGEKTRWEYEKAQTESHLRKLPGDSLLAAASLAYLAPHPPSIRESQTKAWTKVIQNEDLEVTTPFNIVSVLATPLDLRAWSLQGLPADTFSSENAIFIKNSVKWPMLVDPDDQGTRWLEKHEKVRGLVVIRSQDANDLVESSFAGGVKITLLENALARTVPFGRPLLLKDLHGEPPPLLQPILQRCIVEEEGTRTITMGSLKLKYQKEFRLYMATRNVRPNLPRESINNINLINFTVTLHGLSDLLRQVLVQNERPELEDERERLATSACDVQRRLQETESKILHTLSASQGNILESEEAIQVLQEAKIMSDELKQKETEGKATEETILECCRKYEAVSRPAARLYLLVASLPNLSNVYQFSLTWFMQLYILVMKESGKSSVLERRLNLLQERLLSTVHKSVVKSLAVVHRLPFSVMLTLHALSSTEKLAEDEHTWILQLSTKLAMEAPEKISDDVPACFINIWPLVCSLKDLDDFQDIERSIISHKKEWQGYIESDEPSLKMLPKPFNNLKPLHALILVSVICPSQILKTAIFNVTSVLGTSFAKPPLFEIAPLLQSNVSAKSGGSINSPVPLLLVTAPGVDALEEVMKLASRKTDLNLTVVSMGQGQEEAAESAINNSIHNGGWVILQNLHHARVWLPSLARMVNEINESYKSSKTSFGAEPHPEFRLILTTQPTEDLPITLLRHVEKIAVSPPIDAKAGLVAAIDIVVKDCSTWGLDDLDMDAEEAALLFRLLHGLAIFHVLVSERGRHGQRAWAAAPTFTQSDLVLALSCVRSMVEAGRDLEKEAIEHLVGRVIYGGRIRRPQDEFVILSLLREVLRIALESMKDEEDDSQEGDIIDDGAEEEEDEEECASGIESLFPDYIGELSDLTDFVQSIEGLDDPELFGLPRSVKAVQAAKEGEDLLTALTNLGGSVEEFTSEGDTTTNILLQLMSKLPLLTVLEERYFMKITDKDMADVLQRECDGLNATLLGVRSTIENAIMLLKTGNSGGNEEIAEDVVKNIPLGRTPNCWGSFDSLPTPPMVQSFVSLLWMRSTFFKMWITEDCPSLFWLGNFQFLPAFLSLVLRQAALLHKFPLHLIGWKFKFTEDPSPDPTFILKDKHESTPDESKSLSASSTSTSISTATVDTIGVVNENEVHTKWMQLAMKGLQVFGLWLVGAAWDEKRKILIDSTFRQIIQLLPILEMIPSRCHDCGELTARELNLKSSDAYNKSSVETEGVESNDATEEDHKEGNSIPHLKIKQKSLEESVDDDQLYMCPVYEGSPESSQSPVIFTIPMAAGPKGANHWIQRRVAIYTSKH